MAHEGGIISTTEVGRFTEGFLIWLGPQMPLGYWQARPVRSGFPHPPSPQAAQLRRPGKERTPPHLHRGDTNKRQTITTATRTRTVHVRRAVGKARAVICAVALPQKEYSLVADNGEMKFVVFIV